MLWQTGHQTTPSRLKRTAVLLRVAVACAISLAGSAPARARSTGSLGMADLLERVKDVPKLADEIRSELKKNKLEEDKTGCIGFRFWHDWPNLVGVRAAPYECEIGDRTVVISARRVYLDADGKPVRVTGKASRKKATSFRESHFRWRWKPTVKP